MDLNDAPRFLTYEQLADCIAQVQYKPDWTISVFNDPYEGPCLYLTADVVDGYDHTKTVPLRIRSNIPHCTTPGDFYRWLQWRLIQVEIHEAREYFHVDGEPWSDPHDVIEPYREGDERATQKTDDPWGIREALRKSFEKEQARYTVPPLLKRVTVNPPSPGFNDNSVSLNVEMRPEGSSPNDKLRPEGSSPSDKLRQQGKAHPDTMAGS